MEKSDYYKSNINEEDFSSFALRYNEDLNVIELGLRSISTECLEKELLRRKKEKDSSNQLKNKENINFMIYLNNSKTSFHCSCGCNVFKKISENKYECNCCETTYESY